MVKKKITKKKSTKIPVIRTLVGMKLYRSGNTIYRMGRGKRAIKVGRFT